MKISIEWVTSTNLGSRLAIQLTDFRKLTFAIDEIQLDVFNLLRYIVLCAPTIVTPAFVNLTHMKSNNKTYSLGKELCDRN